MLTIDLLANQGDIGGGEVMLFNIADALRQLGHPVRVLAPESPAGVADEARERGLRVETVPGAGRAQYLINLRRHLVRRRSRLVWANGLLPAVATAGLRNRIVHYHQVPKAQHRAMYEVSRIGALAQLVPSMYMQRQLPGTTVFPNWVANATKTIEVDRPRHPLRVGFLGRLSKDKGILTALEAIEILEDQEPGRYELWIGGEPRFIPSEEEAEITAALETCRGHVKMLGWVDTASFLSDIDVLVVPSIWGEPFGLVVIEAMSAKVPVMVSDSGALPEVIGSDPVGIFPADNPMALVTALLRSEEIFDADRLAQRYRRWDSEFSPVAGRRRVAALIDEASWKLGVK